jgi:hypothetical protein
MAIKCQPLFLFLKFSTCCCNTNLGDYNLNMSCYLSFLCFKVTLCRITVQAPGGLWVYPQTKKYIDRRWPLSCVHLVMMVFSAQLAPTPFHSISQVKYDVRSPKVIWAPCAQLYSLAKTPQPPSPCNWAHIYEGAIGQPR